ncbi:OmpA family protein [Alteromonadaceae bacterium M269]|nr:OmpA family protein [Alteromonadaceae bacterium M269]
MSQIEGPDDSQQDAIETQTNSSEGIEQDSKDMQRVRDLLLGNNRDVVTSPVKQDARSIVSEVFSEALFDRQKKDGSVDQVILPLVENSVENSINNHREQFVGYLYPLVGSLVRKSVTAFISEFLEKTNELIENSFTIKGLKWRYRAWRAGVSFSEYAASQTFQFRVKQVLLIHRKTGLLLKSVAQDHQLNDNADLVSSMLGAINDFVSDSFTSDSKDEEQNLGVVKTDNFTLLIKQGPYALLVAAVNGNESPHFNEQLQTTLEQIHRLYLNELVEFDGDDVPFDSCEKPLRDCLINELKPELETKQKQPWIAIILAFAGIVALLYYLVLWWQNESLVSEIKKASPPAGVIIRTIEQDGVNGLSLEALRDPQSTPIEEWLQQFKIGERTTQIKQELYLSAAPQMIQLRVESALSSFSGINTSWNGQVLSLSGLVTVTEYNDLQRRIEAIPGFKESFTLNMRNVSVKGEQTVNVTTQQQQLYQNALAEVQQIQFDFPVATTVLDRTQIEKVQNLADKIKELMLLAEINQYTMGVIVIGTADSVGASGTNTELSQARAEHVKSLLVEKEVASNEIMAVGIGKVELAQVATTARKVLINVVYHQNTLGHTEREGN